MKIPYGRSYFGDIRRRGFFYADKTPFLPLLESDEAGYAHVLFLRPRRFGKSTLLSMLEHYYDAGRAEQWDELFQGLWIFEHPTAERSRYLVLSLDFSMVAADSGPEALRQTFFVAVRSRVRDFLITHRARVPELRAIEEHLDGYESAEALLAEIMSVVRASGHQLYVLIDEYDSFANRLLSDGEHTLYESVVQGTGFVRSFYATLKAGTGSGAIARMFITGVSPILLDDLSSGFNILTFISQHPAFNTLAGFTRADVERAVDELLTSTPRLGADPRLADRARLLQTLEEHYNGYRFAEDATERVFNSDMVLYFLRELRNKGEYPVSMLDLNVRTDHGQLQRMATLAGVGAAERRALLEAVLTEGYVSSRIAPQLGSRTMASREQLASLFYYLGMLTIGVTRPDSGVPRLEIPNRVIRELQWEYLALTLREQENIWLDTQSLEAALGAMALRGDVAPLLALFQEQVIGKIGVKDQRQFNEKTLKLMLLAYISQSRMFRILSEKEFARGYCDLFLGLSEHVPAARFAWMLELKYLPTKASKKMIESAFAQAGQQLARYTSDAELLPMLTLGKELRAGALVFVGAREVLFRAWPEEQGRTQSGDGGGEKSRGAGARAASRGRKRRRVK